MTFADLDTEVEDAVGDATAAQRSRWINQRYKELVGDSGWLKRQVTIATTVADQAQYALDDDVATIDSLTVGGSPYREIRPEEREEMAVGWRQNPMPGVYSLAWGSTGVEYLELYPVPDTTGDSISALVESLPSDLSGELTPVIPADFHFSIAEGAIARGILIHDEDPVLASAYEQRFENAKVKLRVRKNIRGSSGVRQVKVMGVHF